MYLNASFSSTEEMYIGSNVSITIQTDWHIINSSLILPKVLFFFSSFKNRTLAGFFLIVSFCPVPALPFFRAAARMVPTVKEQKALLLRQQRTSSCLFLLLNNTSAQSGLRPWNDLFCILIILLEFASGISSYLVDFRDAPKFWGLKNVFLAMALATEKKRTCENEIRSFKAVSSVRSTHGKIKWSIIVPDILLLNYPNLGLEKEKTKRENHQLKKQD